MRQCFTIHQSVRFKTLRLVSINADFFTFCFGRMKLAWLLRTRPEVLCETSKVAQVTEKSVWKDKVVHIKSLNSGIK